MSRMILLFISWEDWRFYFLDQKHVTVIISNGQHSFILIYQVAVVNIGHKAIFNHSRNYLLTLQRLHNNHSNFVVIIKENMMMTCHAFSMILGFCNDTVVLLIMLMPILTNHL